MDSEYEVRVLNIDTDKFTEKIENLGAKYINKYHQKRYIYDFNPKIDIDTWPHLNTYVEFEGKSKEAVFSLLKQLDIKEKDVTTMDAQDLYLANGYTLEDMNDLKF